MGVIRYYDLHVILNHEESKFVLRERDKLSLTCYLRHARVLTNPWIYTVSQTRMGTAKQHKWSAPCAFMIILRIFAIKIPNQDHIIRKFQTPIPLMTIGFDRYCRINYFFHRVQYSLEHEGQKDIGPILAYLSQLQEWRNALICWRRQYLIDKCPLSFVYNRIRTDAIMFAKTMFYQLLKHAPLA